MRLTFSHTPDSLDIVTECPHDEEPLPKKS